jgi:hypothetical protein
MKTSIYTPVTSKFAHIELVCISVGKEEFYPIYLLPMDAERGRDGFPTTQETVERDITAMIAQDFQGGIPEEVIAMLSDEAKASMNIDTNLHSFAVEGMKGKVPCLSTSQLTELVLNYARNKDCDFCWDLLDILFFVGLKDNAERAREISKYRFSEVEIEIDDN